jgi:hypothetical protein
LDVSIEVALEVCRCCVTFHCIQLLKQWLKCNTGKVFHCLNRFLLTVVLSIEEHVFLVEYVFRENRYTDLVQEQFAEKFPETSVPHRSGGQQNLQCIVIAHASLMD